MPKDRSRAWNRFYYEFFERSAYEQWHDGINPNVVLELKGEERAEAEDLLIKDVKKGGMWPTKALGLLKSKKALQVLKDELKKYAFHVLRIRLAEAIEEIEESGDYVSVIIDELLNDPSEYTRLEAAMVLRKFPRQDVIDALYKGVMDKDYLVRNHASESLLKIHSLNPSISEYKEIFQCICFDKNFEKNYQGKEPLKYRGKDYDIVHAEAVNMLKKLFETKKGQHE